MATKPRSITIRRCLRCGHEWAQRAATDKPTRCPNPQCRTPYWDKPRKEGK